MATAAPLAAPTHAPGPSARRAAPAPEPAEVHIHIGRIEVMAAPEAAPRRARPEAKAPPRSLDAYLAARNRT